MIHTSLRAIQDMENQLETKDIDQKPKFMQRNRRFLHMIPSLSTYVKQHLFFFCFYKYIIRTQLTCIKFNKKKIKDKLK
jgi:hypothetical protein